MGEHWGAKADPNVGVSPYSGQLHYGPHTLSDEPFTSKPSNDGSGDPIEIIEAKIHNMHPEQISALADQWENAKTLLTQAQTFLLSQSHVLANEHWRSSEARNKFLEKGPGQTLVYLDLWIEAAQTNVTALRHLTLVAQDARRDIDEVMRQYREELANAKNNVDFGDQLGEWFQGLTVDWEQAKDREIHENVSNATKKWTIEAQKVAHSVGQQYYPYISLLAGGMGPPIQPLDAVLNDPGHNPMPRMPGLPGGGAPPAPPPPVPGALPPPPALLPPPGLTAPVQNQLPPPPPVAPPAVIAPPAPAPVPVAGAAPPPPAFLPPPMVLPAPPPGFSKLAGGVPTGAPAPGSLPPGAPRPGLAPSLPPAGARPPNPGQLTKNAFQRPGTPGTSPPPGKTLRRPSGAGAEPGRPGARDLQRRGGAPGRPGEGGESGRPGARDQQRRGNASGRPGAGEPHLPGGRRQGDRSENEERAPGTPIDGEEAFGRPAGGATPPVLKNPTGDRNRSRPGSSAELRPAAFGNGDEARREGAAPPVLNAPSRPGVTAPPPQRRRGEREQERTRTAPTAEWVGADEARAEAGRPVLDAPAQPPSGSRVSRLEEVPRGLRSRGAAKAAAGQAQPARPGSVAPELSKRRTDRKEREQPVDDEARGVVTDEQAFDVATPGGGVVTSKRDQPTYEPEPRRVVGGQ